MARETTEIEHKIGYRFVDPGLLSLALAHASSATAPGDCGNERLEFIGDAVIGLVVARLLFDRYPDKDEGWLTQMRSRLVEEGALAAKARAVDLGDLVVLSKGEEGGGGRNKPSILAGAYEALIGAAFLDGGYEVAESIIRREFREIDLLDDGSDPKSFKSLLQERLQKDGIGLPAYEVIEVFGPEHERSYVVAVFVEGSEWGRGSGRSKKEAEMEAAREALSR
jgi:ribonuclease-3